MEWVVMDEYTLERLLNVPYPFPEALDGVVLPRRAIQQLKDRPETGSVEHHLLARRRQHDVAAWLRYDDLAKREEGTISLGDPAKIGWKQEAAIKSYSGSSCIGAAALSYGYDQHSNSCFQHEVIQRVIPTRKFGERSV
ncbi:hypothetical protein R3P38DRAFT_2791729 [Favolaschia claudopus]|uniref:Uncharacterized protein n=1 Tax=Favolaschia claudopus TaxID=2862362 RepID=A0AAW0AHT1_9AGAR